MLFNSIHFLVFFPVVVLAYYLLPHKFRWVWLLVCSYYFYMAWNPRYALLISTSIIITFVSGVLIERANQIGDEKKRVFMRKLWVVLSFASNLAILFFFKYFWFALGSVNRVLALAGMEMLNPQIDILLPVSISFYTFQALGYTMDVYRGDVAASKNIFKYALFVSFFPQLVAGPIERTGDLLPQFDERHYFDYDNVKDGLLLMLWGFFQKIVVADRLAALVDAVYQDYSNFYGSQVLVALVLYSFQIYCDFAGYSDIAVGAAQVMGFRLKNNFRQPYFAASIREFWQRWHISLSTWFRDYLYIPLGGNRCSKSRKYFNLMVTFLVSGLWHGAQWSFVVWGGLHGAFQVMGEITAPHRKKLYEKLRIRTDAPSFRWGQRLMTFTLVTFAWIFFRAPGTRMAVDIILHIFNNFHAITLLDPDAFSIGLNRANLNVALSGIAILLVGNYLQSRMNVRQKLAQQNFVFRWACYYGFVFYVLYYGVLSYKAAQTTFIYFQF